MSLLENINSPDDLKELSYDRLGELASEIRGAILAAVSENGGHLASNLGVVEAVLALHKVFDAPQDRIIFDVSHQCYAHKILTGRYKNFSTLRKAGGVSGFSNPAESPYDPLYEGHCGTSISQALAFATADAMEGKKTYTVAVAGDGAFTNGMIYEALNNCSAHDLRLIILLNDNEMCISENIGGMNNLFRRMRSSSGYFRVKHGTQKVLRKIPLLGKGLIFIGRKIKNVVKNLFLNKNIFENFGLEYIGPVDGNNVKQMCSALAEAKRREACCVVHMITKKGMGYAPAEEDPSLYHSVSPFDLGKGIAAAPESFSARFGGYISDKANENAGICAITAAMCDGTGLSRFAAEHPERFFDVGIAEEHAVTFGAALSAAGKLPVCAIYSTFAQRAFDQLFQDVSLGNLHFILALDRCGFVSGDGVTHQGIFDYSLFSSLPECNIYSPATYSELENSLDKAIAGKGLQIVRYPKGGEIESDIWRYSKNGDFAFTEGVENCGTVIVTYGRIARNALSALSQEAGILRLVKAFPFDLDEIKRLTARAKNIYLLEEGIYEGGMAQKLSPYFIALGKNVAVRAVYGFVKHGSFEEMCSEHGFAPEQIALEIKTVFKR